MGIIKLVAGYTVFIGVIAGVLLFTYLLGAKLSGGKPKAPEIVYVPIEAGTPKTPRAQTDATTAAPRKVQKPQRTPTPNQATASQPQPRENQTVDRTEEHQKEAKRHAENFFRYKYKPNSQNGVVRTLNIEIENIAPVTGWGERRRTRGEAMLQFFNGRNFENTTRRFEVLTDEKDGKITATDLNLLF